MGFIDRKKLGAGVGLRAPHRDLFLSDARPDVSWVEVITENYLPSAEGLTLPIQNLLRIRENYPVALHGVSLNLGSVDPLHPDYLRRLAWLEREVEPWLVSDHLCWTGTGGENLHDLLPLPVTREALAHVAARVQKVQDLLRRPIAIENISYYARPLGSEMPEHELLAELVKRTGCKLLLDVNNLYVNKVNLGISPEDFVNGLDLGSVAQLHLAGHSDSSYGFVIDTHGAPVAEPVWALYERLLPKLAHVPAMIERDANIPEWEELGAEVARLQGLIDAARKERRVSLAEWQKLAHKAIRSGEGAAEVFAEPARVRAYSLSFPAVVRGSLEDDFPLLMRLLGRARFHALVKEFHSAPRGYFVEVRAIAPAFLKFLETRATSAAALRAARIDLLAEEARLAPEPAAGGKVFGLHPSVRFLEAGRRRVIVWRQEGEVLRERLSAEERSLLRCFERPAELGEISLRLERSGLEVQFVQEAVAAWSGSGVIGAFSKAAKRVDFVR